MACNCATQEQLNNLYKKYGNKVKPDTPTTVLHKVRNFITQLGVGITLVLISPFLLMYIFYKGVFDKEHKISVTQFFRLKKGEGRGEDVSKYMIDTMAKTNE